MFFSPVSSSNKGLYEDEIKPEDYFPMQNVKFVDNQRVAKSVVEMWYAQSVKILPPNCIDLHIQMLPCRLRELALANGSAVSIKLYSE